MGYETQYEAFEAILKEAFPNVPVFQANMPLLKMDELARAEVTTVTYLFYQDTERVNTSGPSGVHDVTIEVNLFGPLDTIDGMAESLNTILLSEDVDEDAYTFTLVLKDKKDIWEAGIKSKRIWMQYTGLMIVEDK